MVGRITAAGLVSLAMASAILASVGLRGSGTPHGAAAGVIEPTATATPLHGCQVGAVKLTYPFEEPAILEVNCPNILPPGLAHWTVDIAFDDGIVAAKGCQTLVDAEGAQSCSTGEDTVRFLGDTLAGTGNITLGNITFSCIAGGYSVLSLTVVRLEDATQRPIGSGAVNSYVDCNGAPPTATPTATPVPANGDVNKNGHTDSIDAALVLQYRAGLIAALPHPENADVNEDGNIDALDALLILQYDAGLLDELPV